jgi:hypothetical protein
MSESLANQGHAAEAGVTRVKMLIGGEWRFEATEYAHCASAA